MKRIPPFLTISAVALLALAVVACGSDDKDKSETKATVAATSAAAAAPTTAATQAAAAASATSSAAQASSYTPRKVASSVAVNGAGATFPNPFYSKAFDEYNKKVDPNVKINYQSIGSSGGVKNFTEKTVDFGASDAFLTEKQFTDAGGADNVFMIPTVLGAIALTWNLPGYSGGLKLTPETLAGIFLGDIKKWSDPKLKADNPGVNLPDAEIAVVHRSDGSGTTNNFTSYLALVSPTWKDKVGAANSVEWPTGIGASGNDGVTGSIKQTPGSIGYVELNYAQSNKLPVAELKNKAGKFVKPTLESTAAAASDTSVIKDNLDLNVLNTSGDAAYPIVTATWLIVNKNYTDELKGQAIVNMLWWITHGEGQALAGPLDYATLPKELVTKVEAKLKQMTVNGKPVISS